MPPLARANNPAGGGGQNGGDTKKVLIQEERRKIRNPGGNLAPIEGALNLREAAACRCLPPQTDLAESGVSCSGAEAAAERICSFLISKEIHRVAV